MDAGRLGARRAVLERGRFALGQVRTVGADEVVRPVGAQLRVVVVVGVVPGRQARSDERAHAAVGLVQVAAHDRGQAAGGRPVAGVRAQDPEGQPLLLGQAAVGAFEEPEERLLPFGVGPVAGLGRLGQGPDDRPQAAHGVGDLGGVRVDEDRDVQVEPDQLFHQFGRMVVPRDAAEHGDRVVLVEHVEVQVVAAAAEDRVAAGDDGRAAVGVDDEAVELLPALHVVPDHQQPPSRDDLMPAAHPLPVAQFGDLVGFDGADLGQDRPQRLGGGVGASAAVGAEVVEDAPVGEAAAVPRAEGDRQRGLADPAEAADRPHHGEPFGFLKGGFESREFAAAADEVLAAGVGLPVVAQRFDVLAAEERPVPFGPGPPGGGPERFAQFGRRLGERAVALLGVQQGAQRGGEGADVGGLAAGVVDGRDDGAAFAVDEHAARHPLHRVPFLEPPEPQLVDAVPGEAEAAQMRLGAAVLRPGPGRGDGAERFALDRAGRVEFDAGAGVAGQAPPGGVAQFDDRQVGPGPGPVLVRRQGGSCAHDRPGLSQFGHGGGEADRAAVGDVLDHVGAGEDESGRGYEPRAEEAPGRGVLGVHLDREGEEPFVDGIDRHRRDSVIGLRACRSTSA